MKKQTVSLLILLLAASSVFFSCGNTVNKNTGALEFDSLQVNETVSLFNDSTKPACNLVINQMYIKQSSDKRLKDSLNKYIQTLCFGQKYANLSPQKAVEDFSKKYVTDYLNDLEPMYKKDEENKQDDATMQSWYSYYKYVQGQVQFYAKNLLVYRYRYEEYTGGAHGIYMTSFLNINLQNLSPLRLKDIFAEDYKIPLTDLLWNQLMADNKVVTRQELEDLGYGSTGELEPTENFYLDKEGITFHYNVYEVTPYAMGALQLTLPYEMLQHLLIMNYDF